MGRTLLRTRINDLESGMWVLRRRLLREVGVLSDGMAFSQELKIRCFRAGSGRELPITYRLRLGKPKLNAFRDGFSNLTELISMLGGRKGLPLLPTLHSRFPVLQEIPSRLSVDPVLA
jgi:hypothetical protein